MRSPRVLVHVELHVDVVRPRPAHHLLDVGDVALVERAALRFERRPADDEADDVEPQLGELREVVLGERQRCSQARDALVVLAEPVDVGAAQDHRPVVIVDDPRRRAAERRETSVDLSRSTIGLGCGRWRGNRRDDNRERYRAEDPSKACHSYGAMATIGVAGGLLPSEPWKGLSLKLKTPPSLPAIK